MRGEINKPSLLKHIVEYYSELTEEEAEIMAEAEQEDEWIEDADGNFVKKQGD